MSWIKRWLRKEVWVGFGTLTQEERPLTVQERRYALMTLHHIQAMHSLLGGAANRLSWRIANDEVESRFIDATAGLLFADWMILGEAWVGNAWQPAERGAGILVEHPRPPLAAARALVLKLRQLERAQIQAFWRWGASVFITPADQAGLVPTPHEREAAREALSRSLREAGVGGIEFLPYKMEFVELQTKPADFAFDKLSTQLLRELCNLFGVDSSLLNDPENKTYSNKTEAQKALYVNVIIPNAYLFAELLNRQLILASRSERVEVDPSNLEPLAEERERQTTFMLQLYQAGVISADELRNAIGL